MELMGRETDLDSVWKTLQERSFLLTGPRRVGKTELLKSMERHPRHGHHVIRADLQGISTVAGAVDLVLGGLTRAGLGPSSMAVLNEPQEANLGPVGVKRRDRVEQSPWARLELGMARATERLAPHVLVLCLDEVPWWLDDVARQEGSAMARAALARLRAMRQHSANDERLRMVLTGSVGLAGLARQLGASADINDLLPAITLRPLVATAGTSLFETEVLKRDLNAAPAACWRAQSLTGGSPYWLKILAERVQPRQELGAAEVDVAAEVVLGVRNRALFSDEAGEHFRRRYPSSQANRLLAVLDAASSAEHGVAENVLLTASLSAGAARRSEALEDVHELVDCWLLDPTPDGGFRFLLPLFRLWWLRYGGAR